MPVCGNYDPSHNKCEVLEISKNHWKNIASYPFDKGSIYLILLTIKFLLIPNNANSISSQAVVYAYSSYFYFGGSGAESTIARLNGSSYKWSKIGRLNEGRYGHNAIFFK